MTGSPARRRGAFAAAGLIGLCALAVAPARAADDGYANVFSSVLGSVGIIKSDPPPAIEYRERPPLVLPKAAELPKPVAGEKQRSAAWPQDPDVVKRRKEVEEARAPHGLSPGLSDKGEMLSHDDTMRGRSADNEPVRPSGCGNDGQGHNCMVLSPDVLRAENEHYRAANPEKGDTVVAGQEPAREYLTQPPKGYLKPVKTVKATAEAPVEKVDESSARYMQQEAASRKAAE